jgi:hypothetical protein
LEEANLSKRSRKDLKRAMPHLSVSMSNFLEVAQNGIDKATSIKVAEKLGIIKAKSLLWGMQGMIWR